MDVRHYYSFENLLNIFEQQYTRVNIRSCPPAQQVSIFRWSTPFVINLVHYIKCDKIHFVFILIQWYDIIQSSNKLNWMWFQSNHFKVVPYVPSSYGNIGVTSEVLIMNVFVLTIFLFILLLMLFLSHVDAIMWLVGHLGYISICSLWHSLYLFLSFFLNKLDHNHLYHSFHHYRHYCCIIIK